MNYINRINEIQARAKVINLRMDTLCGLANIAPSTFYRWQDEDNANPRLRTLNRVLDTMEEIITTRERAVYRRLREKFGATQ